MKIFLDVRYKSRITEVYLRMLFKKLKIGVLGHEDFIEIIVCHFLAIMKSFDKRKLSGTTQNYARINVILLRKNLVWKSGMNWAQMSKRNLNLWLKSRNKEILSTILLNRISHLALERVYHCIVIK